MSRALFLHAARDARVSPYNLREGRPGETLLEVAAVGLCGSDLHYYKDGGIGSATIKQPFVPGHEFGAWLTEDLDDRELPRGTLVAVDPNNACRRCEHCRAGHENLCPNVEFIGAPPNDGAMTDRLWVDRCLIVPVPQSFSPADVVMLEPLGVAIHAADLAKPRLLETVTVLGCGPIGLLILQVLKVAGAGEILAVDPLPHRRELAARLRGLTVKFSRRMGHVYPRAIKLVQKGLVDVRSLVTDEVTLEEAPAAFRRLEANEPGRVKTIIYPGQHSARRAPT
jgi:L-iditol 2-dehydrogenase